MDDERKLKKWNAGRFQPKQIENTLHCILYLQKSEMKHLLDHEYTVTLLSEYIGSTELERRIIKDWFGELSNDINNDNKLYQIARYIYEKENADFSCQDSDQRANGIRDTYKSLESMLNVKPCRLERDLTDLINEYISFVGKEGIVGILAIKEDSIPDSIRQLRELVVLNKVYKLIRMKNAPSFSKIEKETIEAYLLTIEQQKLFIEKALTSAGKEPGFGSRLYDLISEAEADDRITQYSDNVNIGLDELQLIFMKPETLQYFQVTEAKDERKQLKYRSIEEIGEFLMSFRKAVDAEDIISRNKTGRGFAMRLDTLRSNDRLEKLIKMTLLHAWNGIEELNSIDNLIEKNREYNLMQIHEAQRGHYLLGALFDDQFFNDMIFRWLEPQKTVSPVLLTYLKIKLVALMAERNLRDVLLAISDARTDEEIEKRLHILEETYLFTHWANSPIMMQLKTYKTDNIFEQYAKALSRRKEQIKYKKIMLIWNCLVNNIFSLEEKHITFHLQRAAEQNVNESVEELSDAKLSRLLTGKRDSQMSRKKKIIKRIAAWYAKNGCLILDVDNYVDFKSVYDVVYAYKIDSHLKEENIQIGNNTLKYEEADYDQIAEEEKLYLILGIYISTLFNRGNISDKNFVECCNWIYLIIDRMFQYFDLENHDEIMILINAYRASWIECLSL